MKTFQLNREKNLGKDYQGSIMLKLKGSKKE